MVRITSLVAIVAALYSMSASAKVCNKADTKFVGKTATLKASAQQLPGGYPLTVSGTAQIVDGCTFMVQNYIFLPGTGAAVWYGRRGNDGKTGVGLTDGVVSAYNNMNVTFPLKVVAGAEVSFEDFDTLVLFDSRDNLELATAQFADLVPAGASTGAGGGASGTTSGAGAGQTNKPNASSGSSGNVAGGVLAGAAAAIALAAGL
ncbi:hypothetical protein DFS34DRAFT_611343 [Phlyctochytrium arcticum]|nr:hypothetical protein DFS34DRAFT_611343 [Phlyctochytrium arcticum]